MKKIISLHEDKWVSLYKMVWPEKHVGGYVYSHETRCEGHIISLLPFKSMPNGERQFLLREEITPCWDINAPVISSITGGAEKDKTIEEVVLEELEQEGGYIAIQEELIPLGTCYGTKSSDTIYHLFSVDLTGKKRGLAIGDGSKLEQLAKCEWYEEKEIIKAQDPFVYVCYHKLMGVTHE